MTGSERKRTSSNLVMTILTIERLLRFISQQTQCPMTRLSRMTQLSSKTGRGPLGKDWETKTNPIICIYKLFIVDFAISDSVVPEKFKSFVIRNVTKGMSKYHKKLFCSMDEWVDLTMEEIRKLEKECAELLPEEMNKDTKEDATAFN